MFLERTIPVASFARLAVRSEMDKKASALAAELKEASSVRPDAQPALTFAVYPVVRVAINAMAAKRLKS